jgi:hypothetical protein
MPLTVAVNTIAECFRTDCSILGDNKEKELRHVFPYTCLSAWNNSAPARGGGFTKFYIRVFFEDRSRKFKFRYNVTNIIGTLHEGPCTFVVTSHWILLGINISVKGCTENQHTFVVQQPFFFFSKIVSFMI